MRFQVYFAETNLGMRKILKKFQADDEEILRRLPKMFDQLEKFSRNFEEM